MESMGRMSSGPYMNPSMVAEIQKLEAEAARTGNPSPLLVDILEQKGGPFPSFYAALGGIPQSSVDVPICAVFLVLFAIGAAAHMTILQLNLRKGHKFIISGVIFGFCMARVVATSLRIAWSYHLQNANLAIASNVFVAAGVVLLYIVNLILVQRVCRATHPTICWRAWFHWLFIFFYVLVLVTLAMIITCTIQSFFTLNGNTRRIDRDVALYAQTCFAVLAFLPLPFTAIALLFPRAKPHKVEKFGTGRYRHQIAILLTGATLLTLGAAFRAGTSFAGGTRPRDNPANYQDKACFYVFTFTVEILTVYLYAITRVDQRFHIPNGSHGPGAYLRGRENGVEVETGEAGNAEDSKAATVSEHANAEAGESATGEDAEKETETEKE